MEHDRLARLKGEENKDKIRFGVWFSFSFFSKLQN